VKVWQFRKDQSNLSRVPTCSLVIEVIIVIVLYELRVLLPLASTFKDAAKPGRMVFLQNRCVLSHKGPYLAQKLCRRMQTERAINFFSSSRACEAYIRTLSKCSLWTWWSTGVSPSLCFQECETAPKGKREKKNASSKPSTSTWKM